jgi:AraC-like DNA-binding protein
MTKKNHTVQTKTGAAVVANPCDMKPQRDADTYRVGESDDLMLVEKASEPPSGNVYLQDHGLILVCTAGRAQHEYDGHTFQLRKNDLFLYMVHSVLSNIQTSPDFSCRQIWFSRADLWSINTFSSTAINDIADLKLHPLVHLSDDEAERLDTYFGLMTRRMSDCATPLDHDIVRSLCGTMLLEVLRLMRRNVEREKSLGANNTASAPSHKKALADFFIRMVEESDGRLRSVERCAERMHITPKYLSNVIQEVLHLRPSFYIQHYTLKAIERRLRFTDMTMQQIANELRFPNASSFGRYFKARAGMTPLEYRMKYKGNIE